MSGRPRPIDPEVFIRASLPLAPAPGVAEVLLHQATPSSGLWRLAKADPGFGSPYWAYPWAGGLALARYVLDRPETAAGRRVVDLGAGSGLVAIAAALAGAREVMAVETDRYARAAIPLNAAANDVAISIVPDDPLPDADLVLGGDVFYDRDVAERTMGFLDRCLAAGREVLIGDPGRAFLPLPRLRRLAEHPVSDFGETKPGGVYALLPESPASLATSAALPATGPGAMRTSS